MTPCTASWVCVLATLLGAAPTDAPSQASAGKIAFETDTARYTIGPNARLMELVDKASGVNYAAVPPRAAASVKRAGKEQPATAARFTDGKIQLDFGADGASVTLGLTKHKRHVVLEVLSVSGEPIDELTFVHFPLALKGDLQEPFAASALALNLRTRVPELPGLSPRMRAMCYPKFGLVGAAVALAACPTPQLRDALKEAVSAAPELPRSSVGGPWAMDSAANRESYIISGGFTEKDADSWIQLVSSLGIKQIDFHGGHCFRFGDCQPNPKMFPQGRASFKAMIDKIHAAGMKAGLHTYAFFMARQCPWVTPVPDPRLGKDATFSLAQALDAKATEAPVVESTERMSAVTGFFVRNSVTLQIDDELITYTGVSKQAPYVFTGCKRGAWGTKAASHAAGAKVHHLKECFGLFAPDGDSTLLTEVAAATADIYNECGFDMIYLDALDGEDVLGGRENSWHYGSKFVFEICKRLKRPAIMEMSTFHHHLWCVRSRMGAWDHPNRSFKKFIDTHCRSNLACDRMFLPSHLGWWAFKWGDNVQVEKTYSDDVEYLLARCIAHDCGYSPQGFTPVSMAKSPLLQRYAALSKRYEELRLAGAFGPAVKARLAEPGAEFTLTQDPAGRPCFRPASYLKHKVEGLQQSTSKWTAGNRFASQPIKLRIEALHSVAPYDSPKAVTLVAPDDASRFGNPGAYPGVTMTLDRSTEQVKVGEASCRFTAQLQSKKALPADAPSWAHRALEFEQPRNLSATPALGVWVHGDGGGEVLNLQFKGPSHLVSGLAEHYVVVDFDGWRYFELVEPEGDRVEGFRWPYAGHLYAVYRELLRLDQVSTVTLWCNRLPSGKPATCYLSPVKALPLVKTTLVNPTVTVNGRTITFPVELATGCYLEYYGAADCTVYDANGTPIQKIVPQGTADLQAGDNQLMFACQPPADGVRPRATVTVISHGELLTER